ncbi:MAG: glycosyltransferase family 2 protein [Saprospiraceae bacterium]
MPVAAHPLSIVVMTYNEEENIGRCLQSVTGLGDEIFILDSYSTDRTVELAEKMGARVEQFPFDSYADQRRRMIQMAKNDWILILDADEYLSDELRASVIATENENSFDAYTSHRKSKIGTTWLNHGSWYPDKKIRMFDRRKISVIGIDIHETLKPITKARIGHLQGDLLHLADQDIESRFQKVQYYSTRAAGGLFRQGRQWSLWRILFKPVIRFISIYFIRLGILDGYYGYIVAKSEAHYVWLREVKLWEIWKLKE